MDILKLEMVSPFKKIMVFNAKPLPEQPFIVRLGIDNMNSSWRPQIIMICKQEVQAPSKEMLAAGRHRVLFTPVDWPAVLQYATDKTVGLLIVSALHDQVSFVRENIQKGIPATALGQLLAFLYARFKAFAGKKAEGVSTLVAIENEEDSERTKAFLIEVAHLNGLEYSFLDWLETVDQLVVSWPSK